MDQDDIYEEILEGIRPTRDEFMERRIKHRNFAKIVVWLSIKSRKEDFIYAGDLVRFIGLDRSRVHSLLADFVHNRILRKKTPVSNIVEYWFVKENEIPIIQNYFEKAKKPLGIDFEFKFVRKTV